MNTPKADTEDEATEASSSVPSFRRIWKKHNPNQGSSFLSLKAMSVLYDSVTPLSRDDLADRLTAQLTGTERSFLEAWHLRRREARRLTQKTRRGRSEAPADGFTGASPIVAIVREWLSAVFAKRVSQGQTLVQDGDGRYRPGPKAPRVLTMDGQLLAFTPDKRLELEQAEHDEGRAHLAMLEWERITAGLDLRTLEARAHLLILLTRRLLVGLGVGKPLPLDERRVQFNHLLRVADTPAVKRAVLQRAFDALWAETSKSTEK